MIRKKQKSKQIMQKNQDSNNALKELDDLRQCLDRLDLELITVLKARMAVSLEIGKLKRTLNLPSLQDKRWKEACRRRELMATELNLDCTFVARIFEIIHNESLSIQNSTNLVSKQKTN